jgi:signal peptidase II
LTDSDSPSGPAGRAAFRSGKAVGFFVALAVSGLAADLLTKHYVFESLLNDPELQARAQLRRQAGAHDETPETVRVVLHAFQRPLCPGVNLTLSTNPGVVFGWAMPPWAVIVSTLLTVALVGWFFAMSDRRALAMHLAMALILAGALGNLYDRLFSSVAPLGMEPIRRNVRDFIDCSQLHYPWVFNIADVLLVVGVGIIAFHWILGARREKKAGKSIASARRR